MDITNGMNGMSLIEVIQLLLPLIIIELSLKAFCIVQLVKHEARYLPKWAWLIGILLISGFGSIAYLLFGRKRY